MSDTPKPSIPKTQAEPIGKKKLNNMSVAELRQLTAHLVANNQTLSTRFRQIQDCLVRTAPRNSAGLVTA
jgi:hypothetical protein